VGVVVLNVRSVYMGQGTWVKERGPDRASHQAPSGFPPEGEIRSQVTTPSAVLPMASDQALRAANPVPTHCAVVK
jgi:hypothetical protein